MEKTDLARLYPDYYRATTIPAIITCGEARFITISGKGDPNGPAFSSRLELLYPVAYGIKKIQKNLEKDFAVPKLEGLWWVETDLPYLEVPRDEWHWKLLLRLPDYVNEQCLQEAITALSAKISPAALARISFEKITEGHAVQILHKDPYANEPQSLATMDRFITDNGWSRTGRHHEIYLSNPLRTAPERLRTILRHPVIK